VDSTGIKVRGEGEWHAREQGGARRRVSRKLHLAIDDATLERGATDLSGIIRAGTVPRGDRAVEMR
jgi:hypothetical protein